MYVKYIYFSKPRDKIPYARKPKLKRGAHSWDGSESKS